MRLLNTRSLMLRTFEENQILDEGLQYAILSHVWNQRGEVQFEDMRSESTLHGNPSYLKLLGCCNEATKKGYDWVWIDTCCIDKSSSAELSEAINSMFRWYQQATICFALLEDVPDSTDSSQQDSSFRRSKWSPVDGLFKNY